LNKYQTSVAQINNICYKHKFKHVIWSGTVTFHTQNLCLRACQDIHCI
jgi:hypothetical protein